MASMNGKSISTGKKIQQKIVKKSPSKSMGKNVAKATQGWLAKAEDMASKKMKDLGQGFNNFRGKTSAQYRLGHKKDSKGNWS